MPKKNGKRKVNIYTFSSDFSSFKFFNFAKTFGFYQKRLFTPLFLFAAFYLNFMLMVNLAHHFDIKQVSQKELFY